jgi:hypothetical protein
MAARNLSTSSADVLLIATILLLPCPDLVSRSSLSSSWLSIAGASLFRRSDLELSGDIVSWDFLGLPLSGFEDAFERDVESGLESLVLP